MGYSLQKRVIVELLIAASEHTDLTFFQLAPYTPVP